MKPLQSKTAIVTGGSRGIGAAIARKLAADGANVAITYGKSAAEAEKLASELVATGIQAKAYQVNAADKTAMAALPDTVQKDFGSIDIIVNNAGVFSMGAIGDVNDAEYTRVMATNVDGPFALINAATKYLKAGARIINISSALGERAGMPGISLYTASKFAVSGLTRAWAKDFGAKGILVNAILPGPIDTEMNPETSGFADFQRSLTAIGRYGKPDEIGTVAAFLAGPGASYVSGALIAVDGGWNA